MPKTRAQRQDDFEDSSDDDVVYATQRDDVVPEDRGVEEEEEEKNEVAITDEGLEILCDIIQYESEMILWERDRRAERFQTLSFYWSLYPYQHVTFGQLYVRSQVARLLASFCAGLPYADDDDDASIGILPMKTWGRQAWENVIETFDECANVLPRADTSHLLSMRLDDDEIKQLEEPENIKRRREKAIKSKWHDIVRTSMEIQMILSPIRADIEDAIDSFRSGKEDALSIHQDAVEEVLECSERFEDNKSIVETMEAIFSKKEGQRPKIKSLEELLSVFEKPPLDLEWLQRKLEFLCQQWCGAVFEDSPLLKKAYRIENTETIAALRKPRAHRFKLLASPDVSTPTKNVATPVSPAALEELREGREALKSNHGNDPLESSRKMAQLATRADATDGDNAAVDDEQEEEDAKMSAEDENHMQVKKMIREDKKRKGVALTFAEDIEEEEEEDAKAAAKLGGTPQRPSAYFPVTYDGPFPDEGTFDHNGKVAKRRRFTVEEKEAIKSGLRKFGWEDGQKWVKVKKEYGEVLRNRTAVQIKDAWRTMVKKGEVNMEDYEH